MTSKLRQQGSESGILEVFPDFPPRDDMQNSLHLYQRSLLEALAEHLGNRETTIALGEVPVRWTPGQTRGHRIPDLLVALNVDQARAIDQNGYSIRDMGKPPDFVMEIASVRTAENDIGPKRVDYANFGIPECWRFDPTGGRRYDAPLAGDRLVAGTYQPIEIVEVEAGHLHGHSVVIGLGLCWDQGNLRWYDPATGQHLSTLAEERQARIAAEERIRQLEERLGNRRDS